MQALSRSAVGIGLPLPGNVRRSAVDALEDRGTLTDIATRRDAQPADQVPRRDR